MLWRLRWLWVASGAVLYVGIAALQAASGRRASWVGLFLGPLVVLAAWRLTGAPRRGEDRILPGTRRLARLAATGVALAATAHLGPPSAAFVALRCLGTGLACAASIAALARPLASGGVAARPVGWTARDGVVFVALLWAAASGLALWRAALAPRAPSLALAVDYAAIAASVGSAGAMLVAAARLHALRRFELEVAERMSAALWLGLLLLSLGVLCALLSLGPPERLVPLAVLAAAVAVSASATVQRAGLLSRVLRTAAACSLLCAPVAAAGAALAYELPTHAGLVAFAATAAAATLGLLSPQLATVLAPERGRWLLAARTAIRAAQHPDPQQAAAAALRAIRDGLPPTAEAPALCRLASSDRVVVDRAGYQHLEPTEVPPALLAVAENEPERVLATEALRAAQVRRPEVRHLVGWLDARAAGVAALVLDEEVTTGVLLWPSAGRRAPLSVEEVKAIRELCDHLGAATGAAAQLARSRARELEAERAVAEAHAELGRLRATLEVERAGRRALVEVAARRARTACFGPAAQAALVELERLATAGRPFALVAACGVDAVGWASLAHLCSARAAGPLVLVEATRSEEQPLARWSDPASSPLGLARGGTMVIQDAHVLPVETQRWLGRALAEDTTAIVILPSTVDAMAAAGRMEEGLADRLGDRAVVLPTLEARAEDLRALALHALARIGLRRRGRPYGLSMEAQELLGEHDWPGNDAELEAVLLRAVLRTEGDVVEREVLKPLLGPPGPSRAGSC